MIPIKPTEIFGTWSVDIYVPITPVTKQGFKYIMVTNEHLLGYPVSVAIPNQEAITIAQALFDNVFTLFGAPARLLSDRGQTFMSRVVVEQGKLFNMHKIFTSTHKPSTNSKLKNSIHSSGKAYACTAKIKMSGAIFSPRSPWHTLLQSPCRRQIITTHDFVR